MNIAVLTTVHIPLDGRIFYKEAVSLRNVGGHSVTLVGPYDVSAGAVAREHQISYVGLRPPGARISRFLQWIRLMRFLCRHHFDVWHFHDPELLPLAVLWRKLFSRETRLVYDVHEDYTRNILEKEYIPPRLRRLISRAFQFIEH
jgi:hypothetical protein